MFASSRPSGGLRPGARGLRSSPRPGRAGKPGTTHGTACTVRSTDSTRRVPFTSSAVSRGESAPVSRHAGLALALVVAAAVVTPLSLRALNRAAVGVPPGLGYLPALELSREHRDVQPAADRQSPLRPAGLGVHRRLDDGHAHRPGRTSARSRRRDDEIVAFLFHPATGPAWWYLAFKNHLVASGVKPRAVFVFFRDTNLTDTLFRLESLYGNALDEVAHAQEPELNAAGRRAQARRLVAGAHRGGARLPDRRRHRLDGAGAAPLVRQLALSRRLGAAALRPAPRTSASTSPTCAATSPPICRRPTRHADFARDLPTSVLPAMTALAREHGITLCFVRVQRRPTGHDAAAAVGEPAALRRRSAGLARGQRRAVPRRLGRPRAARVDLRRRRPRARSPALHRRCSAAGSTRCSDDLPQPGLRRLLPDRRDDLLAAAAPGAEPAPARGQLPVLRLGASVVRGDHAGLDHGGLLGRPADGGRPGAQAPVSRAPAWP